MMLTADMEPHHLARLKQLALIEETGTDFRLTDLGRQRLCHAWRGTCPSPIALAGSSAASHAFSPMPKGINDDNRHYDQSN